jgi:signal transduction histidine kinase
MYHKTPTERALKPNILALPAVLAYVGVAVSGLVILTEPSLRYVAAGLLVGFGVLFFGLDVHRTPAWLAHVRLALETALVAGLMILQPGWGVFPILFFILSPETLIRFPNRIGVLWVGIFTLVTGVSMIASQGWPGLVSLLVYVPGYFFFAIFGWTTDQAMRDRRRSEQLLAELQTAHAQLQQYANRLEELTITQERNRISREMHDTLGHRLTVASVQLEGAQRLIPTNPNRALHILTTVREQIREGLGELRRTVALLRAPLEEDLPLQQALPKLAAQVQEATGMQVHVDMEGCPAEMPPAYRQAFYRAGQEALTNVQRHAQASEAWLQLSQRDGRVALLVSDNGVGLSESAIRSGFGLTGLKERAALLYGEFFIDPRPGGGTQLTFRLPLPGTKEATNNDTSHG